MKSCYGNFKNDRTCELCVMIQPNYAKACESKYKTAARRKAQREQMVTLIILIELIIIFAQKQKKIVHDVC